MARRRPISEAVRWLGGFVYVMRSEQIEKQIGRAKIGFSTCPVSRMSQIKNGKNALRRRVDDIRITTLCEFDSASYALAFESLALARFSDGTRWQFGDWLKISADEEVELIEAAMSFPFFNRAWTGLR